MLKQNLKEFPLLETFITDNLDIIDNTINIKVANKAEEMKFKSIEVKLIDLLNSVGYDEVNVKITIDEEKSKEIRKEIEEAKVVEVPTEKKEIIEIVGGYIPKVTHEISGIFLSLIHI